MKNVISFENLKRIVIQEKKGKKTPEIIVYVYEWQDKKIVIEHCGRGLHIRALDNYDKPIRTKFGALLEGCTDLGMYDMKDVMSAFKIAVPIANKFYWEINRW